MAVWGIQRRLVSVTGAVVAVLLLGSVVVEGALAHGGSGVSGSRDGAVPTWLVLVTGGLAVGASFLLASLVTDRGIVRATEDWGVPVPGSGVLRKAASAVVTPVARGVGLVGLGLIVLWGLDGAGGAWNPALLVVWTGWWGGFTATTYLLGNSWPLVNPWRTLARGLPSWNRAYPEWFSAWPAVLGLLAIVWVEVASPAADDAVVLLTVVAGYTVLTMSGVLVFGPAAWFGRADPLARLFRCFDAVAPFGRRNGRFGLCLPGSKLGSLSLGDRSEVAFVVALVWVTTFDGLVTTPAWRGGARTLVAAGLPPTLLYSLSLGLGFGVVYWSYLLAIRLSRTTADTYLSKGELARRFAPSLVAIAAGYHLAHYLGAVVSLVPAVVPILTDPSAVPATVPTWGLPSWFDLVGIAAVLGGHLVAIWVAHATAFRLFPGRVQAIRSQYPIVAVMVGYTGIALWIVAQPTVPTPYT